MTSRIAGLLLTLSLIAGCAGSGAQVTPILDGEPTQAYQRDLEDCRSLARGQNQLDQETVAATLIGAVAGAAIGDLDDDGDALGGAVAGGLLGGVSAAVEAMEKREEIVFHCLRGRGHRVVG
jgi:uncharacterized protein YcfJ